MLNSILFIYIITCSKISAKRKEKKEKKKKEKKEKEKKEKNRGEEKEEGVEYRISMDYDDSDEGDKRYTISDLGCL